MTGSQQPSDVRFVVQRGDSSVDADLELIHGLTSQDIIDAVADARSGTYATVLSPIKFGAKGDYNPVAQTGTDDTTALAAWAAAVSTAGVGYLPAGYWKTTQAITFTGPVTLICEGVTALYAATGTAGDYVDIPTIEPFLAGSVIVQCGAGLDAISLPGVGKAFNVQGGLGILFDKSIRYTNTGHGINATPPTIAGGRDQGMMASQWGEVKVFGHDGNHYAVRLSNSLYSSIDHLESFGGGGLYFENNHPNFQYGNFRNNHAHIEVFCNGTADGVRITYTGSQRPNLFHFGRLQSSVRGGSPIAGVTPTAPATTQQCINVDPLVDFLAIDAPDFEGTIGGPGGVTLPTAKNVHLGAGGSGTVGGTVPYVLKQRAGARETAQYRREMSDLTKFLSFPETAPSAKWPLLALHDGSALTVRTDGVRNLHAPGAIIAACGQSGDRPNAATVGVGAMWYDSTLKKVLFSDGTQWTDAAGTAVAVPSAGAAAATDGFTRANNTTTLGRLDSGQVWGYAAVTAAAPFGLPTFGILSNKAYAPGNNNLEVFALVPTNLADCTIQVTLDVVNSNKDTGLVVRWQDSTNYWKVNALVLRKTNGGSNITHSTPFASGDVMKVILSGTSITVQRNGVTVSSTTDAYLQTATTHGLRCYDDRGTSRWSAFSITAP